MKKVEKDAPITITEAEDVAAKRYPMMGTYLSNDVVMNRKHFAKGYVCHAAISQQKQDERMIEFARWINANYKYDFICNRWYNHPYDMNNYSLEDLLTIFKAEKGY